MMYSPSLGVLPVVVGVLMAAGIVTSYIVAVLRGDVEALFPYISDTGTKVPESCIFGQFLNMAAFFAIITVYCRYKLIKTLVAFDDSMIRIVRLAMVNGWLGVLASIGIMMVANFQEESVLSVHIVGASLVFGVGVIYAIIDTIITFKMRLRYNGTCIACVRLSVTVILVISIILTFVNASISFAGWNQAAHPDHSPLHWKPSDPGFAPHIVSTVFEWIMALSFLLYFFTFIRDFQKIHIEISANMCVQHLDEVPRVVETEPNERSRLIT